MFSKALKEIEPRTGERKGISLALLLTGWYTAAAFLLVTLVTGSLYVGLADNLRKISEQSLTDELNVCRALIVDRSGDSKALHEEVEIDSAVRRYQKFYIRVLDRRGTSLSTTPGMDQDLSASRFEQAARAHQGIFRIDSPRGAPYRAILTTVAGVNGGVWTLQMAVDLTQEQVVLGRQRIWTWAVLAAALIFCPAVGFLIARWGTRPLREVANTAQHISSSTLSERISIEGYPLEVRKLAAAFNAMLERLEESFTRLSRFSADIAHELRNPVNNIRGEAEVALARARTPGEYADMLTSCLEESVRLSELIDSLLFLARSESPGDHLNRSVEDIGQILTDLREYYDAAAADVGVALTARSEPGVQAEIDRALLQRALGNLISNALAHCSAGDQVCLAARQEAENVLIEIRDTGPGIPANALPRVFDRFFRADPARSRNSGGAGLGLAIVRQIVTLHGGQIQIASEPDCGTTVWLSLPSRIPAHPNAYSSL